jgi:TusA-related sulfurtransferase
MEEHEVKVNARGLSAPGPRLMVQTALKKGPCRLMRVVVSTTEAVADLQDFFASRNATTKIDQVGEEYHVLVEFEDE